MLTSKRTLARFAILVLPILAALFGAGCQIVDQDRMRTTNNETLPWNERADWEDATLGIPY